MNLRQLAGSLLNGVDQNSREFLRGSGRYHPSNRGWRGPPERVPNLGNGRPPDQGFHSFSAVGEGRVGAGQLAGRDAELLSEGIDVLGNAAPLRGGARHYLGLPRKQGSGKIAEPKK